MQLAIRQHRSVSGRLFIKLALSKRYWIVAGPWGVYLKRKRTTRNHYGISSDCQAIFGIGFHPLRLITWKEKQS